MTVVNTAGIGLWMALNVIYAITVIGLTPGELGIGLGVASGLRLVLSAPTGHLADRCGPRVVQVWSFAALVPLTLLLTVVHGFAQYVVVVSAHAIAYGTNRAAQMAMVAGVVPADDRVRIRGYLRAATNVSISVGAGLAGLLLVIGTPAAFRWAIVGNAVTYALAGLLTARLPTVAPQPARRGPRLVALRDRPFLVFVLLDGLLSMHYLLLDVVLPLWIVRHTEAPKWMVAALLLANTVLVVLLQVRATRGTDDLRGAARAARWGGVCVAIACVVFSMTGKVSALAACALLGLGALVHVLGEVRQAAGSWGISFGLAPDHAQGQYQGAYSMGIDLGRMLAPVVLVWLALEHGVAGWLVMAGVFGAVGLAMPPVVAWARTRRPETAPVLV
ncbi:MFS transporter [Actinokineospora alba]|uniref:MFS transporter n=1 Tax=Actinokineospora alba TaxID=504798 RepID=UPI001E605D05|nr:MFS transporter [Actinokineospora alba]